MLSIPTALHISEPAVTAYTMSAGRLGAIVASLVGLAGIIIGGLALARPASQRRRATIALIAGLIGMAIGGVVVATSDSGIGTGNGRGGAYVALIVGLISIVLGWLALGRSRRTS